MDEPTTQHMTTRDCAVCPPDILPLSERDASHNPRIPEREYATYLMARHVFEQQHVAVRLIEPIGYGAVSVVVRAAMISPVSGEYAVKILKSHTAHSPVQTEFVREAERNHRLYTQLRAHAAGLEAHMVECFATERVIGSYGASGNSVHMCYTQFELVDAERDEAGSLVRGPSFLDYRESATRGEIVEAAEVVAYVLTILHGSGVLHRDIKPANLLVPSGKIRRIKLADLSHAVHRDELRRATSVGTPGFGAPEQFVNDQLQTLDYRVDMYGIGAVLFYMLTGTQVYTVAAFEQFRANGTPIDAPPAPNDILDKKIPGVLNDTVVAMTQPDREKRPESLEDVIMALARAREELSD